MAAPQAAMAMTAGSASMVASLAFHWADSEAVWTQLAEMILSILSSVGSGLVPNMQMLRILAVSKRQH